MTDFATRRRDAVKNFLQTVLIIDDEASLPEAENCGVPAEAPKAARRASGPDDAFDEAKPEEAKPGEAKREEDGLDASEELSVEDSNSHIDATLDLKIVTDAFLHAGVVAGIFKPSPGDSEQETHLVETITLAGKADGLIVDWNLDRSGNLSLDIITGILSADKARGGRLRAVIVYTAETNLDAPLEALESALNKDGIPTERDDWSLRGDSFVISIYGKSSSRTPHAGRKAEDSQLPELLFTEFETLVNGLLPVFALNATEKLRANVNLVVSTFDDSLDIPFLDHRTLVPTPCDAEPFLLDTLISVFRDLLGEQPIITPSLVRSWLANLEENPAITEEARNALKEHEYLNWDWAEGLDTLLESNPVSGNNLKKLRKLKHLFEPLVHSPDSFAEFAALTTLCSTDPQINKYLTQGTILSHRSPKHETAEELITPIDEVNDLQDKLQYLLCVTPSCDCLRLEGSHPFHFLPLEPAKNAFDLVVRSEHGFEKLKCKATLRQVKAISFECNDRVVAVREGKKWLFKDDKGTAYTYVGELRALNSRKKVSQLITNFNRVGVDELEWLRRSSG